MLMYFIKVGDNQWTDDWSRFIKNYANTRLDHLYCKERIKTALDKTFPSICYITDNVSALYKERIKTALDKTFPSICYITDNVSALYFDFKDPADEAFFLIWSNDGIEI
jgi:hypothetical protein